VGVSVGGGEPGADATPGLWGRRRAFGLGVRWGTGVVLEAEEAEERIEAGLE